MSFYMSWIRPSFDVRV